MISETITKNDLINILNEVLPPTPSEYKKLLWANPNPTSDFVAQTVSLDLSGYDEIEVEARHAPSLNVYCKVKVGDDGYVYAPELSGTGTGYVQNVARKFTVSSNGIVFGGGYYNYGGNSSATASNSKLVPIHIYGIKYERVYPPQADALEWQLAGTATGNSNTVTVPDSAREVMVTIEATSGVVYTGMSVLAGLKAIWNVGGYYLSTSDIGLCNLNVSNSNKTFQIRNCRYGAGDYRTTAILSVYYR